MIRALLLIPEEMTRLPETLPNTVMYASRLLTCQGQSRPGAEAERTIQSIEAEI